ncbi:MULTISPECIES: hypothetical protein [Acinetobacter]|jgi:hypothetical protein|uniref:hypothetical protein n=1 Tax=Acinetobacter TaxID=469 RepID=UPI0004516009|nr:MULTISPECIES: hypothetical protein [Acinetobacter]EHU1210451.1 hypothetical protein [Acinetobacter nosocomialis]EXR26727.1 hypothetical protein J694_3099 [Acinetobacter sp. 1281984]MBR7726612.1 hypothetical protein [Acinetobacter nosocomialis]MCF1272306.1 hypothetical protein [Acinetobacter nosocomialis]OIG49834.1 hypothetical protein A7M62_02770 [Acinetobacter nosocomialis]
MFGYILSSFKESCFKITIYAFFFGWIPLILTSNFVINLIDKYFYFGFLKGISDAQAGRNPLEEMLSGLIPSSKPLLAVLFLYAYIHIFLLMIGFSYRFLIYMKKNLYKKNYEYKDVVHFSINYKLYSKKMKSLIILSDFIFEVLSGVIGAFIAYILLTQSISNEISSLLDLIYNVFLLLWSKKFLEKTVIISSQ